MSINNDNFFYDSILNEMISKYTSKEIKITYEKEEMYKNYPIYSIYIIINNYKFLLEISFVQRSIQLFSVNIPYINDGRDILYIITEKNNYIFKPEEWNSEKLCNIVEGIKVIIKNIGNLNNINKIGRFYLGFQYNSTLINNIDTLKNDVKHIEYINGKKAETDSLSSISDEYFCLYEKIRNNNNDNYRYMLIFYGSLRTLLSFKKSLIGHIVSLVFEKNGKEYPVSVSGEEDETMDKMMDILIEKIKNFGFKMDIYQKRLGEIPNIDIDRVERDIVKMESKIKEGKIKLNIYIKLLENYEKAIEYYSAINNMKYKEYNEKVKKIMMDEKYMELMNNNKSIKN